MENSRLRQRMKRICDTVKADHPTDDGAMDADMDEIDYADVKDFVLIGGTLRFGALFIEF